MVLKKAFHFSVLSDIYGSAIAASIVLITLAVLNLRLDIFSIFAVFFTALVVYALNRQDDKDIDAINVPERTAFVHSQGWIILTVSVSGFFVLLAYAFLNNFNVFAILFLIFLLGLFYSFSLFKPFQQWLGFQRLKEVLGIKSFLVSAMYGAFVLIPVFNAHESLNLTVWLLFTFIFLRFFIVTVIFDLRDLEGDVKKNIQTIPAVYGKERTFQFLHALNILTVLITGAGIFYHAIPVVFAAMVLVTFLFALYYIHEAERPDINLRHLCSVIVEADFLPAAFIALPYVLKAFV